MYAFTELHNDYPAFVNLTEQPDGTMKLTVRTRGNGGRDCASINLAPAQAEELAEAIFKHVYAGESEVPTPPAQDAGMGELIPCAYRIGPIELRGVKIEEASQLEGPALWAVRRSGSCLNKSGEWECEPLPSSRDDAFLARCRFATPDEAFRAIANSGRTE